MSQLTNQIIIKSNEIKELAYSPYSNFKVGASILAANHKIYSGCNIEFCSYGATLCAEASAIANMVTNGNKEILEMAICCSNNKICYPCGICLQRIVELSNGNTMIHLCIDGQAKVSLNIRQLLPYAFNKGILTNEVQSCSI